MSKDLETVRAMCTRLAKYYWSPQEPHNYVIVGETGVKGIGLIAHKNFGAFNLAWAERGGAWVTELDQTLLVTEFSKFQGLTHYKVNGVAVEDWLCLLNPYNFSFLLKEATSLPISVANTLRLATDKALRLEKV